MLGVGVGLEAQLLHHGENLRPGLVADVGVVVQHPGDGAQAVAGDACNVFDGGHGVAPFCGGGGGMPAVKAGHFVSCHKCGDFMGLPGQTKETNGRRRCRQGYAAACVYAAALPAGHSGTTMIDWKRYRKRFQQPCLYYTGCRTAKQLEIGRKRKIWIFCIFSPH